MFLHPETGLLAGPPAAGKDKLFIELSTIDAADSSQVASAVMEGKYGVFVDAPCSVRM